MASGPRDWSPYELDEARRVSDYRPTATARSARNGTGYASLVFGAAALVCAFAPLALPEGTSGFIASTVGISAVLLGLNSLARRRNGYATVGFAPVLGIVAGFVGTAVMLLNMFAPGMLGSLTPSWVPQVAPFAVQAPAPESAVISPASTPVPEYATSEDELMGLAQALGTLVFLQSDLKSGGTPVQLTYATGAISDPTGRVLVRVPASTTYEYSLDSNGEFAISLTGAFGRVATYDSATSAVTGQ